MFGDFFAFVFWCLVFVDLVLCFGLVFFVFFFSLFTDTYQNVDLGETKDRAHCSHCTTAIHFIAQKLSCSCVLSTQLRACPTVNQNLMGY